jgi:tetratricopeptide (TPR) repeat protein
MAILCVAPQGRQDEALDMDSDYARAYAELGETYLEKGMYDDAIAAHKKVAALSGINRTVALLGHAWALATRIVHSSGSKSRARSASTAQLI